MTAIGRSGSLPDRALWRGEKLPFEVQFFHRGFFYTNRVDIFQVVNGQAAKVAYNPEHFSFGNTPPPNPDADLGFAGFRLHAPINKPDYHDEVCVFLGASYFRAVAKGQVYGLSARGLVDQHRRNQGRGVSFLQDILDREAGRERFFDRRACLARQRECRRCLSVHHQAG